MIVGNFEPDGGMEDWLYEDIYEGLKKYRNDETFKKALPDTEDMIKMLEKDKYLLYEYAEIKSVNFLQQVSTIINMFENDEDDDIKWFYENKDKYLKDIICYEPTDNFSAYDVDFHEAVCFYSECKDLDYMDIYTEMYAYDRLYLCTHESFIRIGETVKNGLEYLASYINEYYEEYKEAATRDRDIFKELDDTIILLKEYAEDEIFLKEVPNVNYVISELKRGYLSEDEDIAYKSYWLMSDIRDSIRLYEQCREDMEFFFYNRNLSEFISKDKIENNKDGYKRILLNYIKQYESSEKFVDIWTYITRNHFGIEINNIETCIGYNHKSIREFMEWVISEINK